MPPKSKTSKRGRKKANKVPKSQPHPGRTPASLALNPTVKKNIKAQLKRQAMSTLAYRAALSMALPKESEAVRLGGRYGSDPTAVAKLHRRPALRYGRIGGALQDLPTTEQASFLFRDPLRSMIYSTGFLSTDVCIYNGAFECEVALGPSPSYPYYIDGGLTPDVSNTIDPHGPVMYPGHLGKSDPYRGFLVSVGQTLSVTMNPNALSGAMIISFYRLNGMNWQLLENQVLNNTLGGTAVLGGSGANRTGYYAFSMQSDSPATVQDANLISGFFTISTSNTLGMIWAQVALPKLEEVIGAVDAIRIHSLSLMYTNTGSPLNRQGTILGLQVPKGQNWTNYIDFQALSADEKSQQIDVVNGMYGFLKPTGSTDLDNISFQFASNDPNVDPEYVFEIIPASDFLTIHAQVNTVDGQIGYLTQALNVEFSTVSQWFDAERGNASPQDVDQALALVSSIPQWHENEFHFSDIWDWVKDTASSIWSGIKEVAPIALPLAGMLL